MCLLRTSAGESLALTMPRIGLKMWPVGRLRVACPEHDDGKQRDSHENDQRADDRDCHQRFSLADDNGDPGGKDDRADDMEPALYPCQSAAACGGDEPVVQAEHKQEHATDQVEMGVRGREREILPDPHVDPPKQSNQEEHYAHAHHQRADHRDILYVHGGLEPVNEASAHDFPKFVNGRAAMEHELRKMGTRITLVIHLCDLKSRKALAYLFSGTRGKKGLMAC